MKMINLLISDRQYDLLKKEAAETKLNVRRQIREAISRYLAEAESRRYFTYKDISQ